MFTWYRHVLQRYAVFSGRARRREYWYFALGNVVILLLLALIEGVAGMSSVAAQGVTAVALIWELAILIPTIAITVRRLHDTGRSGWWILLSFIPVIGLLLLIWFAQDGTPGDNKYGPNPKLEISTPGIFIQA